MFYADDNQVYIALSPNHPSDALDTLWRWVEHIFSWNTMNMFKVNPGKTEVLHDSYGGRACSFAARKLWNSLPENIKKSEDCKLFQK